MEPKLARRAQDSVKLSVMTGISRFPALFIALGALNALIAVGAGAYGWHALDADDAGQTIFMMGSQYQMWHGIAIIATGLIGVSFPRTTRLTTMASVLFFVGILFFSGTLYAFGLTGVVAVPHLAPLGGTSLMAGWALLVWAGLLAGLKTKQD